jgi:hypothetical protein
MVIAITDNRTTPANAGADSTTGWTSNESLSVKTSEPDPKELTGCLAAVVSTETSYAYVDISSTDLSTTSTLVYVWILGKGSMDIQVNGGLTLAISDGTNTAGYLVAGSDVAVFRHNTGQVDWQCMLIDTGNLPASPLDLEGTAASLDLAAVTGIGVGWKTLAKAVGGVANCFVDIVRYGNGGLTITGTETLTVLEDIALLDAGNVDGDAFGIVHDLGGGSFGVQGKLLFGDVTTGNDTLSIQDQTLSFEDFSGIGTDKLGLTWQGGSGIQAFIVDNSTLYCPPSTSAFLTATDTDVESLDITGCNILNFAGTISFCTDATNGPNHDISNNIFNGCGQINPGKTAFQDNTISNPANANGGMLISSITSMTNISGISFVSDGTGHAIEITATGTYTFTNFSYSGFGATGTTNAVVRNNSGGAVTINVAGGGTPTYLNITTSTTTVAVTRTLTLDGIVATSEVRIIDPSDNSELDGIESSGTTFAYNYNYSPATTIHIVVLHIDYVFKRDAYLLLDENRTIPIQQVTDRNYSNP